MSLPIALLLVICLIYTYPDKNQRVYLYMHKHISIYIVFFLGLKVIFNRRL